MSERWRSKAAREQNTDSMCLLYRIRNKMHSAAAALAENDFLRGLVQNIDARRGEAQCFCALD